MQGEMSDNRLTLEDFLTRTFPFSLLSRGQAYPWSGEGSSSWEYDITIPPTRGLQAPVAEEMPAVSISKTGTKKRIVKHHLKLFLKDNPALLYSCLAWNDGISGFG